MSVYQKMIRRLSIEKGWSDDRKYCATTADGSKYLLRISPPERHERRKPALVGIPSPNLSARRLSCWQYDDGMNRVIPSWYQKK